MDHTIRRPSEIVFRSRGHECQRVAINQLHVAPSQHRSGRSADVLQEVERGATTASGCEDHPVRTQFGVSLPRLRRGTMNAAARLLGRRVDPLRLRSDDRWSDGRDGAACVARPADPRHVDRRRFRPQTTDRPLLRYRRGQLRLLLGPSTAPMGHNVASPRSTPREDGVEIGLHEQRDHRRQRRVDRLPQRRYTSVSRSATAQSFATRAIVGRGIISHPYRQYVTGNPAQKIRRRFSDGQIEALEKITWSDSPDGSTWEHADLICSEDVDTFIFTFFSPTAFSSLPVGHRLRRH